MTSLHSLARNFHRLNSIPACLSSWSPSLWTRDVALVRSVRSGFKPMDYRSRPSFLGACWSRMHVRLPGCGASQMRRSDEKMRIADDRSRRRHRDNRRKFSKCPRSSCLADSTSGVRAQPHPGRRARPATTPRRLRSTRPATLRPLTPRLRPSNAVEPTIFDKRAPRRWYARIRRGGRTGRKSA